MVEKFDEAFPEPVLFLPVCVLMLTVSDVLSENSGFPPATRPVYVCDCYNNNDNIHLSYTELYWPWV